MLNAIYHYLKRIYSLVMEHYVRISCTCLFLQPCDLMDISITEKMHIPKATMTRGIYRGQT